jgi:hypothetical protein
MSPLTIVAGSGTPCGVGLQVQGGTVCGTSGGEGGTSGGGTTGTTTGSAGGITTGGNVVGRTKMGAVTGGGEIVTPGSEARGIGGKKALPWLEVSVKAMAPTALVEIHLVKVLIATPGKPREYQSCTHYFDHADCQASANPTDSPVCAGSVNCAATRYDANNSSCLPFAARFISRQRRVVSPHTAFRSMKEIAFSGS